MHRLGIHHGAENIDCALVNMGGYASNIMRKQVVSLDHLKQGIRCRMSMAATGMKFKGRLGCGPALTQTRSQLGGIGIPGHCGCHALWAFKDAFGASESFAGEVSCGQPASCVVGSVELFG